MLPHARGRLVAVGLAACVLGPLGAASASDDEPRPDAAQGLFVYGAPERRQTLRASPFYAAALAARRSERHALATPPDGLELDPRSVRADLVDRGLTLYRLPETHPPRGLDVPPPADAWQRAFVSSLPVQPVFEQGAALRIPTDRVVVVFPPQTDLPEARRKLAEAADAAGIRDLVPLRPGAFVAVLKNADRGRALEVVPLLERVEGVLWVEPSFASVFLETPGGPPAVPATAARDALLTHAQPLQAKTAGRLTLPLGREPEHDDWKLALDGHFEGEFESWTAMRQAGSNRVLPRVTREWARDGQRSVYMSGAGLAANRPPDPYREGAESYLLSPPIWIANDRDVFVELWFRASFEPPVDLPRRVHDYGRVLVFQQLEEAEPLVVPIAPVGPRGDLTTRSGTAGGWRKLLFRIPQARRRGRVQVAVHFHSDGVGGGGGLWIDELRVIRTLGSTEPGGDPQVRAQFEIFPDGQVAGRPVEGDPSANAHDAWRIGSERSDVVVALIDDGVDRAHPDLAFWEPVFDDEREVDTAGGGQDGGARLELWRSLFPGEPIDAADRHGTACAGVLGARADDEAGIVGVHPGAALLPIRRRLDDVSIVASIDAAVGLGAHVLVLPWGWSEPGSRLIEQALTDALDAGVIVLAAAGDGVHRPYSDAVDFPCSMASSTSLICVGAASIDGAPKGLATEDGQYWWASAADHRGPTVLAPGTWLHATDRAGPLGFNDGSQNPLPEWTDDFSGTGAATCYAAGVAALAVSRDPEMSPEDARRVLTESATPLPWSLPRRPHLRLVAPAAAVRAAVELHETRVPATAPPGEEVDRPAAIEVP